jgi:hypothetical protein
MERAETPVLIVPPLRYAPIEAPAEAQAVKAKDADREPAFAGTWGPLF